MTPERITLPVFGELQWEAERECWYTQVRDSAGAKIDISITPDDPDRLACLESAAELYSRAMRKERKLLRAAIREELLALYNDVWSRGDARLTERGLMDALQLDAVLIGGAVPITLAYTAGDLFAGHSVDVELDEDLELLDVNLIG